MSYFLSHLHKSKDGEGVRVHDLFQYWQGLAGRAPFTKGVIQHHNRVEIVIMILNISFDHHAQR